MFDQQPSAMFGGGASPLADQIYRYTQQGLVPYAPPPLDETKQALYGMTGIPDLQQAYNAYNRGEYLNAAGQGMWGLGQLGAMAAPMARGAMAAGKLAGPALADTSGALKLGNIASLADRAESLRLENTGVTPNAMESGGFFQRLVQKYLDQGSRGAGEGADDKLIDILRKYGIAGPDRPRRATPVRRADKMTENI